MLEYKRLIDISQPVSAKSAAFPGDIPFKREMTLSYEESKVINLTALTMSPHVGTHVDAPSHIKGDMSVESDLVGNLSLEPFIGEALVLDVSPRIEAISWEVARQKLHALEISAPALFNNVCSNNMRLPQRILFRTQEKIRYDIFEDEYAFFSTDLVRETSKRGVQLLGIDTPSADHIRSKTLEAHHELDRLGMTWLENLDLCQVSDGHYFLIAFPIKFMELEASPVRAVLLEF